MPLNFNFNEFVHLAITNFILCFLIYEMCYPLLISQLSYVHVVDCLKLSHIVIVLRVLT